MATFDQLATRLELLSGPVPPLEAAQMAKQIYLEELQGRIILLRQGRRHIDPAESSSGPER